MQAATAHETAAKANRQAGNAAVTEFNEFANELRASQGQKQAAASLPSASPPVDRIPPVGMERQRARAGTALSGA